MFNQPAAGGGFITTRDHVDHLVLFYRVKSERMRFNDMANEDRREVIVDFVDLDGDKQLREDVVMNSPYVAEKLTPGTHMVLGYVRQLPPKKKGQKGALIFEGYEPEDAERAGAWVRSHEAGQFTAPAAEEADDLAAALKGA